MQIPGDQNNPAKDQLLFSELKELALYIQKARTDIAAIRPADISGEHIPLATDELDAVVGATEDATNKIMDVCGLSRRNHRVVTRIRLAVGYIVINCIVKQHRILRHYSDSLAHRRLRNVAYILSGYQNSALLNIVEPE